MTINVNGWRTFWSIVGAGMIGLIVWLILFLGSWGPYIEPLHEVDVSRLVTGATYAADSGAPVAQSEVVRGLSPSTNATFTPPICQVDGRDVFNPDNVGTPALGKGAAISYTGKDGVDTVTLPHNMVDHAFYSGKSMRVMFYYTEVRLYFDNTWDKIWTSSPARGPKDKVIACMRHLSGGERAMIGLVKAVVFLPQGTPVPAALR